MGDINKILIVGSGFYGSVIAERVSKNHDFSICVIDKRNHIGGNAFSYKDPKTRVEVHEYGSHIFHTSDEKVWNYINQFTDFNDYKHYVSTTHKGQVYSMPINLNTINKFFNMNMNSDEAKAFIAKEIKESFIENPQNLEEKAISLIGKSLYEAFIKGYTAKQWQTSLTELPADIITRLPVRFDTNERYFNDKYEGIPSDGYTAIFEKMLDHPNIDLRLNTDFFDIKDELGKDTLVIYSGPIDRYFDYKYGVLGWRTIRLEKEYPDSEDFQGCSVMNYAEESVPYTRIHEYKHYHPEKTDQYKGTVIFKEYSEAAGKDKDPYYPINTPKDKEMFAKYLAESKKEENVIFGGRLGLYKYLDMHQVISMALNTYENKIKPRLS